MPLGKGVGREIELLDRLLVVLFKDLSSNLWRSRSVEPKLFVSVNNAVLIYRVPVDDTIVREAPVSRDPTRPPRLDVDEPGVSNVSGLVEDVEVLAGERIRNRRNARLDIIWRFLKQPDLAS